MGEVDGPADLDCRELNERIRRVGVGGTVRLTFPPSYGDVDRQGTVVSRDSVPSWFSRALRDHERSLVIDRSASEYGVLLGYESWHARSVPLLYLRDREGIPVVNLSVVERGIQLDAGRAAAEIYPEVGRYGGQ